MTANDDHSARRGHGAARRQEADDMTVSPGERNGFALFPSEGGCVKRFCEQLQSIGTPMEVPRNYRLYRAGDIPDSCYLVQSGRIVSTEVAATGRELVFSANEENAVILLPSILLRRSLTLDFRASAPSRLIRVRREDLLGAMASDQEFLTNMLYVMTVKYAVLLDMFHSTSHMVPWQVCHLLLSLEEKHGVDHDGKRLIQKKYSQQMMADLLHVNRTTIARVMKDLFDLDLVERINDYYCIRSVEKLRRYMDEIENLK